MEKLYKVVLLAIVLGFLGCDRQSPTINDHKKEETSLIKKHNKPNKKTHIQVATENWKPFSFKEDGVIKGSSTKIVQKVLERMNISYSIDIYPWARAYSMAINDNNTLIFAIVRTPEREPLFKWVGQVAPTDSSSFYKLKTREHITLNSIEDAKAYTIVTNRDSDKHQFLLANGFKNIVLESNQTLTIKLLLSKRVDLLFMHDINLLPHLKALKVSIDDIQRLLIAFESRPFMAFSKHTPDHIVNDAIRAYKGLIREGKIIVFE